MEVEIEWAGQVEYMEAWNRQKLLVAARAKNPKLAGKLLLLEHPHTYTLGRRGGIEHLLWDEATLKERKVAVHHVDRGGDITYHGPGQLVGYPILNLRQLNRQGLGRVKAYVRDIEEVLIQALIPFGIEAQRYEGFTGVWVNTPDGLEKIAAIGLRINSRGITSHGFALNVAPDLSYFAGIVPCGIVDHGVTSMAKLLQRPLLITDLIPPIIEAFERVFQVKIKTGGKATGSGFVFGANP